MHTVEQLEMMIPKYSRAYYIGHQMISDAEFDALIEELKLQKPDSPILSSVGWGGMDTGFSHRFKSPHIGSLVTGISEKPKYPSPVKGNWWFITPKIDGGSICLYYKNHVPFAMITRGNGKEGINVLHKFVDRIPAHIEDEGLVCFRGEAYTPKSKFKELEEKGVPSPRNYSNGILNRESGKDDPDLKYVSLIFYQVRIADKIFVRKNRVIEYISKCGLPAVPWHQLSDTNPLTLKKFYEEFQNLDYPIDGVVLTGAVRSSKEEDFTNISEESLAYKFESESAETTVTKVEWTTGSSGRINPVVHFNPIFLSGANIQKASGFNAKFILDNSIGEGATIKVTRSNEVIPYIQETINPIDNPSFPSVCPTCGEPTEFDGVTLYCKNDNCPSRNIESCVRVLELIDIPLGLGGKGGVNINDIINYACKDEDISIQGMIHFIIHYGTSENLGILKLSDVLSPHYCNLAVNHINNLKAYLQNGISTSDFWYILNLPSVGKKNADKLPHPLDFLKNNPLKLTPALSKTLQENREYIREIYNYLTIVMGITILTPKKSSSSDLISVCYTGKTDQFKTRKEFFAFYKNKVKETSVNSAQYLICNEPSSSSKYKYATAHNIPIITEQEFIRTVMEGCNATFKGNQG